MNYQTKMTPQKNHNPDEHEMAIRHAIHILQDACDDNIVLMQEQPKNGMVYLIPSILSENCASEKCITKCDKIKEGTIEYQVSDGLPGNRSYSRDFYSLKEALQEFNLVVKEGW